VPADIKISHIVIDSNDLTKYSQLLYELRKTKGMTEEEAKKLACEPNYLASLMVKANDADGEICGIDYTTKDTLKPALQIIKTAPGSKLVTSAFVMEKGQERYVFGDCAINLYPTSEELAEIAKMISIFAKDMAQIEHVHTAMLSYSTTGSGAGESVDKVKGAFNIIKDDAECKNKGISIFGEMQFDAAFVPEVMKKKAKGITWTTPANVFVFPNIDAGNIGYKIAQRLGGYDAIGPVLIGLALPVNDLSRGASKNDVVGLSYVTGNQCLLIKR
jgi:phosphate acetyltransferase